MFFHIKHNSLIKKLFVTVLIFTKLVNFSFSQKDTLDLFDLSLDSLIKFSISEPKINSAPSLQATNFKPYTVTIITKQEIINSGATDLMQVLRNLAQIEFGTDVINQLGIFVNGIWSNEGKILLLIDGHPMNENLYGTLQFGRHYPVDNIKEIRIIKGSGSIFLGQYAELMVINIITETPENKTILTASSDLTHNDPHFTQNISLSSGLKLKKFNVSVYTRILNGHRSDQTYTDIYGNSFNLLENRVIDQFFNARIYNKKLKISFLYDKYKTLSRDYFTEILSTAYPKYFTTASAYIRYGIKLETGANITFKTQFKYDNPWESFIERQSPGDSSYYKHRHRIYNLQQNIDYSHRISENLSCNFGANYSLIYAKNISSDSAVYWNGSNIVSYYTTATYGQLIIRNDELVLSPGLRLEYNPIYGFTALPRIAASVIYPTIKIKQIYARSYRTPTIANINYNIPLYLDGAYELIRPELFNIFTTLIDLNILHNLGTTIIANYQYTKNAITYFVDKNGNEGYANIGSLGTVGLEVKAKWHTGNFDFSFSNAIYRSIIYDTLEIYSVPQYPSLYVGAPNYKAVLKISYQKNNWYININGIYLGPKAGYCCIDENLSQPRVISFPSTILINSAAGLNIGGLSAGIFIYNLLNSRDYLFQGYNGWHAPIPYIGRSIGLKLKYGFNY